MDESGDRLKELCRQATREQDAERVREIIGEILNLLAENHCVIAQSAASRNAEGRLDLHLGLRGLQPGAHAEPDAQRSSDVVRPGRSVSERR